MSRFRKKEQTKEKVEEIKGELIESEAVKDNVRTKMLHAELEQVLKFQKQTKEMWKKQEKEREEKLHEVKEQVISKAMQK